MNYANGRWVDHDHILILQDIIYLGTALEAQGLHGANEHALSIEAKYPALQRT